jgi:hypothetical protein
MFGLLKQRPQSREHRADFRKSYCGTCKAIGSIYGHKERLLLKYDVVFLSELLAELSGKSEDFAHISVNRCLSLPRQLEHIPPFLAYTASVNIMLAGIEVQDNIEDSGLKKYGWRALAWLQQGKFTKARYHLDKCGLRMQTVDSIVLEHVLRERTRNPFTSVAERCAYYSEMTGKFTGEIFRQAAYTVRKPEAAQALCQIGKAYGEMVYWVDALQDYEKNLKQGSFNLLLLGEGKPSTNLRPEVAQVVHEHIAANMLVAKVQILQLPIAHVKGLLFAQRLEMSMHAALGLQGSCHSNASCRAPQISLQEKFWWIYQRARQAFAPEKSNRFRLAGEVLAAGFIALFLVALPLRIDASAPAPAEPSQCWQDCCDSCCQSCCDSCCDAVCDSICNSGR